MGRPKIHLTPEAQKAARAAISAKYARSEKGKAAAQRRNGTAVAKARYARYRETQGYRDAQERRRLKDQSNGWPVQTAARERLRAERPEVIAAHAAVTQATRTDRLIRPDACTECGAVRKLHAHHHLGYDEPHRLDIQWLCVPCHRKLH